MVRFVDLLYGQIELPDWIWPFVRLPEFLRLRGVRLSNVDSIYFKDFSGPSRWEHGIAVAALADRCATVRQVSERERVHLLLAALLHDVGTPPFAHTAESVLAHFDHEFEGQRLLTATPGDDFSPDIPVFQSQLPQFQRACEQLGKQLHFKVDPDEIARWISGEGALGFLINGPIDLDNADNVTRAAHYLGIRVDSRIPLQVADWLATQQSTVADLDSIDNDAVRKWVEYRNSLYTAFFEADDGELARTAFLQHLMRRGLDAGLERTHLIWATDEDLMARMSRLEDTGADDFRPALSELVQRYRLLETPDCIAKVSIDDSDTLRAIRHPDAVAWLTQHLRTERFEPMVLVMSRRFPANRPRTLLPEAVGTLYVFHLGSQSRAQDLAIRLLTEFPKAGRAGAKSASHLLARALQKWATERPWTKVDIRRRRNVKAALESVGDWGFRLSRNDGFHAYPSTFVHALPANLLVALGVKDEIVLDPFGGTAQTAVEALKYGNSAVSADVNTIACLVAKARLTYLPHETRQALKRIDNGTLRAGKLAEPPVMDLLEDWFHPDTLEELIRITGYIESRTDDVRRTFLSACMSAILPACTARRGEQHGYFADNCPLPSDLPEPPYQPAIEYFLDRLKQALAKTERLYGYFERQGRNVQAEFSRASVKQVDLLTATPKSYGVEPESVGAIITSPPYLCMADYALGQRLSYEWLAPSLLDTDFAREIGPRRHRLNKAKQKDVVAAYKTALNTFGSMAGKVVRKGGFVAVVLGEPVADKFRGLRANQVLDESLQENGFERIWSTDRPIHWHRNYGYARLKKERVSVHVKT